MPRLLFTAAAAVCAAIAGPALASAQPSAASSAPSLTVGPSASELAGSVLPRDFQRPYRSGLRRHGAVVVVDGHHGGDGWAVYRFRSTGPDKLNDWWHDNPHRSMPRWMSNNGDCQRIWWSGGGWRC